MAASSRSRRSAALLDGEPHRLIGGVAVVLHQHRLGIDHPIRATADADFGVPPYALKDDSLVDSVASLGYQRTCGNRWVRALPGRRSATVDLLVPSYRTRLRSSVRHGSTNTIEVGGLAEALQRAPVPVSATVALTDGELITLDVLLPDLASLLGLKLHARRVRHVDRDAVDLWTCLELLASAQKVELRTGGVMIGPVRCVCALPTFRGWPSSKPSHCAPTTTRRPTRSQPPTPTVEASCLTEQPGDQSDHADRRRCLDDFVEMEQFRLHRAPMGLRCRTRQCKPLAVLLRGPVIPTNAQLASTNDDNRINP